MTSELSLAFGMLWIIMVLFAIVVLAITFWILMLIDCATKPDKKINKYGGKIIWILIIVLLGFLGAAVYYFAVKRNTG